MCSLTYQKTRNKTATIAFLTWKSTQKPFLKNIFLTILQESCSISGWSSHYFLLSQESLLCNIIMYGHDHRKLLENMIHSLRTKPHDDVPWFCVLGQSTTHFKYNGNRRPTHFKYNSNRRLCHSSFGQLQPSQKHTPWHALLWVNWQMASGVVPLIWLPDRSTDAIWYRAAQTCCKSFQQIAIHNEVMILTKDRQGSQSIWDCSVETIVSKK